MQQGQHAARSMMGDAKPYEVVPYFFSDLADWAGLEYVGPATDWDEVIWRGDRDAGEFAVFYLKDGKVAGALTVESSEELAHARTLLAEGVDVAADEAKALLGDPDSDLSEFSRARLWISASQLISYRRFRDGLVVATPRSGRGDQGSSPCPGVRGVGKSRLLVVCRLSVRSSWRTYVRWMRTGIDASSGFCSAGWRKSELGRAGITRDTVDRVAAGLGFPARRRGNDPYDWAAIRAFYDAGYSAAATMRRFGFRASTWEAAIARGDVTPRPRAYRERPRGQELCPGRRAAQRGDRNRGNRRTTRDFKADGLLPRPTAWSPATSGNLGVAMTGTEIRRDIRLGCLDAGVHATLRLLTAAWADAVKRGEHRSSRATDPAGRACLLCGRRDKPGPPENEFARGGLKENRCEVCGITELARQDD